jgi:hypothetical protein
MLVGHDSNRDKTRLSEKSLAPAAGDLLDSHITIALSEFAENPANRVA